MYKMFYLSFVLLLAFSSASGVETIGNQHDGSRNVQRVLPGPGGPGGLGGGPGRPSLTVPPTESPQKSARRTKSPSSNVIMSLSPTPAQTISSSSVHTKVKTSAPTTTQTLSEVAATQTGQVAIALAPFTVTEGSQANDITNSLNNYLLLGFQKEFPNTVLVDLILSAGRRTRLLRSNKMLQYSGQVWFYDNSTVPSQTEVESLELELLNDNSAINSAVSDTGSSILSVQMTTENVPAPSISASSTSNSTTSYNRNAVIGGALAGVAIVCLMIAALFHFRLRNQK